MQITSSRAYWPIKNGLPASYPALDQDLACEAAIVGGGFTGAITAYYMTREGIDTVLLEKRDVGFGSTSAATALLQYENDTHLGDLVRKRGKKDAVRAYRICLEGIDKIEELAGRVGAPKTFQRKDSLYLASRTRDVATLKKEYALRRRHGFRLDLLDQDAIASLFSFSAPAALLTKDAAQFDPYLLTHHVLSAAISQGLRVFDRTEVTTVESGDDSVLLHTDAGARVRATRAVFATGFESQQYLKRKVVSLESTYAIVTEPLTHFTGWHDQCLIWETARPYLYIRGTSDGRMMIGGEDEEFVKPHLRDRLIPSKARTLLEKARQMFPALPLDIAFAWAGTFGETKDGLPYIGETKEFPNVSFACCFGGNGFTFAPTAAEIVRDRYLGRTHPDAHIFRFDRRPGPGS